MVDDRQGNIRDVTGEPEIPPDGDFVGEASQRPQTDQQLSGDAALWKGKYLHLLADLENTKKRLARTSAQEVEGEKEKLLRDVLPVADGLDLALLHASSDEDNRDILQGIELIRNIMVKFFDKYEVETINAWGKPFDPNLHEAIGMVQHPKAEPNTVVRVEQKGYLYRDKLLRPAQVVVAARR
jgi:molecular chaperone GrpE